MQTLASRVGSPDWIDLHIREAEESLLQGTSENLVGKYYLVAWTMNSLWKEYVESLEVSTFVPQRDIRPGAGLVLLPHRGSLPVGLRVDFSPHQTLSSARSIHS